MALRTRPTQFPSSASGVATEQITAASRLVSYLTGFAVQPNKAIVGGNAFAHESGIHQDGVIKNPLTYEIMTPQSVGLSGSQLTIGKLSGRRGLQGKLKELGYELEGEALDEIYRQAVALADAKKEVTDADLMALVEQRASEVPAVVALVGWSVTSSHGGNATGTVTLTIDGEERTAEATGNGPVNALFGAVDEALQPVLGWHPDARPSTRSRRSRRARTPRARCWSAAVARRTRARARSSSSGHGLSTNIIEASLDALPRGGQQAPRRRDQRRRGRVRRAAHRRGPPVTETVTTYRIATIPGDGVGPEVVAAARRVVDAAGAAFGFAVDWTEFLVGGVAIDTYGVAIRPEDVTACGEADAILLGAVGGPKWSDPSATVRPEQALFALRGGLGLYANLRPVSVHPALVGVLAAAARAARRRRHAHRPRADRRDLLRRADARRRARRAPARRSTRCRTRDARSRGSSGSRSSSRARRREPRDVGRQGQRARDVAPVADASPTRSPRDYPDVTLAPPARRLVRDAARPPAGRLRRHRHREPVRRHPVRRGGGPRRAASGCCRRRRSASAGPRTARSGCTSRSTAPRRTSPARTSRTRSGRSCRRRCCCGCRSGRDDAASAIESRRRRARSTTAGGPATWPIRPTRPTASSWSARPRSRPRSSRRSRRRAGVAA